MDTLLKFVDLDPLVLGGLISSLVLIAANAILGMWQAWIIGEFNVRLMPDFLKKHLLPDGGAVCILAMFSVLHPVIKAIFFGVVAMVDIKYAAKIKDKLVTQELLEPEETPTA